MSIEEIDHKIKELEQRFKEIKANIELTVSLVAEEARESLVTALEERSESIRKEVTRLQEWRVVKASVYGDPSASPFIPEDKPDHSKSDNVGDKAQMFASSKLIANMTDDEFEACRMSLKMEFDERIKTKFPHLLSKVISTIENPSDIVDDSLNALRNSKKKKKEHKPVSIMFTNGEEQRGKTALELYQALFNNTVHKSKACKDETFTILVTTRVGWAKSLKDKICKDLVFEPDHDEEEMDDVDGDEQFNNAWSYFCRDFMENTRETDVPICTVTGKGVNHIHTLMHTISSGGIVVAARVQSQICKLFDTVADYDRIHTRKSHNKFMVIVDESDTAFGSCNSAGRPDSLGRTPMQYEIELFRMMGLDNEGCLRHPPYLVNFVSATNAGPVINMLKKSGGTHSHSPSVIPYFRLLDVLSFKEAGEEYVGLSLSEAFCNKTIEKLSKSDKYCNKEVEGWWEDVCKYAKSIGICTTTNGVRRGLSSVAMQDFVNYLTMRMRVRHASDAMYVESAKRSGKALPSDFKPFEGFGSMGTIIDIVHGGHQEFEGCVGIKYIANNFSDTAVIYRHWSSVARSACLEFEGTIQYLTDNCSSEDGYEELIERLTDFVNSLEALETKLTTRADTLDVYTDDHEKLLKKAATFTTLVNRWKAIMNSEKDETRLNAIQEKLVKYQTECTSSKNALEELYCNMEDELSIPIEDLRPFLSLFERRMRQENDSYTCLINDPAANQSRSNIRADHLSIILSMIRSIDYLVDGSPRIHLDSKDIPINTVGKDMIKRCLSVVAVGQGNEVLGTPTHILSSGGTDGATTAQQIKRFCCNGISSFLLNVYRGGGQKVKILTTDQAHISLAGHNEFNKWDAWNKPIKERWELLSDVQEAMQSGVLPGGMHLDADVQDIVNQQTITWTKDRVKHVETASREARRLMAVMSHYCPPPESVVELANQKNPFFPGNNGMELSAVVKGASAIVDHKNGVKRASSASKKPKKNGFTRIMVITVKAMFFIGAHGDENDTDRGATHAEITDSIKRSYGSMDHGCYNKYIWPKKGQKGQNGITQQMSTLMRKKPVAAAYKTGKRGSQKYWLNIFHADVNKILNLMDLPDAPPKEVNAEQESSVQAPTLQAPTSEQPSSSNGMTMDDMYTGLLDDDDYNSDSESEIEEYEHPPMDEDSENYDSDLADDDGDWQPPSPIVQAGHSRTSKKRKAAVAANERNKHICYDDDSD